MKQPIWTPSRERVRSANLTAFLERAARENRDLHSYADLYRWSVDEPAEFWPLVWEFCGVMASRKWESVLKNPHNMPGSIWFEGARLNFAENLLRFRDDQPALISWNEEGHRKTLSYRHLHSEVARVAAALQAHGVGRKDRVAGFLPNIPETVVAMLASASLGAAWSSCSPDFGVKGVLDRFGQIQPRVLFAADGYVYAGKRIDLTERIRSIRQHLPEIEKVVIVPYLNGACHLEGIERAQRYEDFVQMGDPEDWIFEPMAFDDPLYILYSSGTTGLPKCMIHGVGGTLLQHLKELVLHTDLKRSDRIFYYTTCGWMMWNWLVSSLAVGAAVVLYDGSPFHPADSALFDLVDEEQVTIFGTSAKYLSLAEKKNVRPRLTRDLAAMKTILSTGSPLPPASFDYVYRDVKDDVCLSSISGGTDIVSCFALGNPIGPVYRGELQVRGLGMSVEVFDEAGKTLCDQPGELVCTRPFPSMPVGFWNDPDGTRYRKAYFRKYPGVWHHGDWVKLTSRGGLIIYGRSDATLNPGGVRIGSAEIYRQVETLDEVLESIVVGQEWQNDTRILLFVRLREGIQLDDSLRRKIVQQIRENTSPHHVPARIIQVPDIPRTISGKITELAVRDVIEGRVVKNLDALANPEALAYYRDLEELQ